MTHNLKVDFQFGGVAQMVERFVSNEEAVGSMPTFSTFLNVSA